MKRSLAALTVTTALAAGATAAVLAPAAQADLVATRDLTEGVITLNRGALGVTVGMQRAQVIDRLGRPVYENRNGYMQYISLNSRSGDLFDVYRNGGARTSRVREISIAGHGGGYELADGNAIFASGGLQRLRRAYGRRVRFAKAEDGEPFWEIRGRWKGKPVTTSFSVGSSKPTARIAQIFITRG